MTVVTFKSNMWFWVLSKYGKLSNNKILRFRNMTQYIILFQTKFNDSTFIINKREKLGLRGLKPTSLSDTSEFFFPKNAAKYIFAPLKILWNNFCLFFQHWKFLSILANLQCKISWKEVSMLKKQTKIISKNFQRWSVFWKLSKYVSERKSQDLRLLRLTLDFRA